MFDLKELQAASAAVYLATEPSVASDIARLMLGAANEIERLRARLADAETSLNIYDEGHVSEYWVSYPNSNT